jgi:hypothetical protein
MVIMEKPGGDLTRKRKGRCDEPKDVLFAPYVTENLAPEEIGGAPCAIIR